MLGCDTVVALGAATRDGSTIFARNSDREALECQVLQQYPRQAHAEGAVVRCQYMEQNARRSAPVLEAEAARLLAAGDTAAASRILTEFMERNAAAMLTALAELCARLG